ncbi:MAG: cupin domain-containing protein [Gammaproteobacteria bacterium]|nr:cupin domain-containing protein [Gammaproteobacteria bacterium]
MKIKRYSESENKAVSKEGFKGMRAYFCLSKDDGCPRFAMRVMEFEPYGHTSVHSHPEEHEVYFLEGKPGYVDAEGTLHELQLGDVLYVEPNEVHQFKNLGDTVMRMICVIPILPGGDGKVSIVDR